ncbi:MAG: beta-lactamase family protein [Bryobacteraceae bacterium]|nr:beta-lactamase family protein [Bryobacteraceae bacterium]
MSVLPKVDELFEGYFKSRRTPGLVYGVVVDGELVHVKAMGVREVDSKAAVTADTGFRIASMTKSFTALAILKLRDMGKLSLDDAASKWVPELASMKLPTRDSGEITVRQLLTHGAGFPEDNPWGDRQLAIPDAEMGRWVDRGIPFSTVPDSSYEYSNYGFALLGRIIAKASGVSYEQYLDREILRPLGMTATTLSPSKVPGDRVAVGYGLRDGKYFVIPSLEHGSFGAMGGLVTTAKDMAKYVAFHLAAEPARDDAETGPVKRSSVREM